MFSGGQEWHDFQPLYDRLDQIKARIPTMTLCTTGQRKGCDAIAAAWAARNGVPLVTFAPQARHGRAAGFKRNDQLVSLRPVEAVICQGSGIQSHLLDALKDANVPVHAYRYDAQRPTLPKPSGRVAGWGWGDIAGRRAAAAPRFPWQEHGVSGGHSPALALCR
ncbi:DUF2493 domain-containing protein, partial [Novosphingobium sp. ST904]|uniref:DUF2493 domain-containing protein n=1 Tax=Novosphingobium sp. ST904 TaxID=1684385 RepID=UPI001E35EF69